MGVNFHEGQAFEEIFFLDKFRPVGQMIVRFGMMTVPAESGREQACDVAVEIKKLHRHLRGDKRVVRSDQVRELSKTKRQRLLIQRPAEYGGGQEVRPTGHGRKTLEPGKRFVAAE